MIRRDTATIGKVQKSNHKVFLAKQSSDFRLKKKKKPARFVLHSERLERWDSVKKPTTLTFLFHVLLSLTSFDIIRQRKSL